MGLLDSRERRIDVRTSARFGILLAIALGASPALFSLSPDTFYFRVENDTDGPVELTVRYSDELNFWLNGTTIDVRRTAGPSISVEVHRFVQGVKAIPTDQTLLIVTFGHELRPVDFLRAFLPALINSVELRTDDDRYFISRAMFGNLRVCVQPISATTASYVISVGDLIRASRE